MFASGAVFRHTLTPLTARVNVCRTRLAPEERPFEIAKSIRLDRYLRQGVSISMTDLQGYHHAHMQVINELADHHKNACTVLGPRDPGASASTEGGVTVPQTQPTRSQQTVEVVPLSQYAASFEADLVIYELSDHLMEPSCEFQVEADPGIYMLQSDRQYPTMLVSLIGPAQFETVACLVLIAAVFVKMVFH